MLLESYVAGGWRRPGDEGEPLLDAATGAEVARWSTEPVPAQDALTYAREVGGPALRALTFHERAGILKALGQALMAGKGEFYELSYATGATARDSGIDVDGGIGTLLAYASKARRELPNDTILVDGDVERLGRAGTFVAQHVLTPLRGAAVQINAYNFPVWGMLEKLAPAFVAGVPSVVKPAGQTAYLTELVVRRALETGLLPEGSLQLLCGRVGDLLDHLGEQDLLGFTGSAATAQKLRTDPAIVERGVRFNAEADSLNAAVLGPDAAPGTPEFDLFVKEVVREMTAKAGQKCTAIRRAFVPREHLDAAQEALREALAKVVVGDPRDPATRMGALVSVRQRDDVREAVARIAAGGRVVSGDPDVAVDGFEQGAFLQPLLLRVDDPAFVPVHEVEAFGPVSTLVPYSASEDVVGLLARGRGSLVASVMSHDPHFVREVVTGAGAHHGRILLLDRDDAKESTGHGSPLPHLVHGGPGRAGGGEELGGIRGVTHHLQRTAVQGSPDMLTAVTGRWVPGATRHLAASPQEHPFRKTFHELRVGDAVRTERHVVTADDVARFAELTGDTFYAHTDEKAAAANPLFGGIVAHGYLVLSLAAGLFVDPAPGPVLANTGLERLRFTKPVKPGTAIEVTLTCQQKDLREGAGYGEVRWHAEVTDDAGDVVATYQLLTMVAEQRPA